MADGDISITLDVDLGTTSGPIFATPEDVETRLARTLTAAEEATVELLLTLADEVIAAAAGKTVTDLAAMTPRPTVLRIVSLEVTCRALANPEGLASVNERLGQWASTRTYHDSGQGGGLFLTQTEEQLVRQAVWGTTSGSTRLQSVVTTADGECEFRVISS